MSVSNTRSQKPLPPVAQLQMVSKTYPTANKPSVNNLSLELYPGEILALLGPNGAGKTTTVKMLAGLILPTQGEIQVMGYDMTRKRTKGVRYIGAVLEGSRNVYWRLSARENLLYFGGLRLVPRRELLTRITSLLNLLGLGEHQDKEVRYFSRGMQQKLAIAAALLHDPPILLLDEPTLGLDVSAAKQLEETILHLAREQEKTILLTTHTMSLAEKISDRISVIHEGHQIACDKTSHLLQRYNWHENTVNVRVKGQLIGTFQATIQERFPDVQIELDDETTTLAWLAPPQTALVQLLHLLDSQNVEILNVSRRQISLEEVFLHLTENKVQ